MTNSNTTSTARTFQPEEHDAMLDYLGELSPHGETVTNADGSVTVTVAAR